jgi:predicted RecB family nuclease
LVCEEDSCTYHPFWAATPKAEAQIWQQFLEKAAQYPDVPIYHHIFAQTGGKSINFPQTGADSILKI